MPKRRSAPRAATVIVIVIVTSVADKVRIVRSARHPAFFSRDIVDEGPEGERYRKVDAPGRRFQPLGPGAPVAEEAGGSVAKKILR
ncbi:hypothetical protein [Nocardia nepalensis]|uniref:hypothetical protein n=1 Tax=Nocardia nepalensis TaxID=3375448 RepID=UPI003B67F13F